MNRIQEETDERTKKWLIQDRQGMSRTRIKRKQMFIAKKADQRRRYMPGLDGLRALAVLAVIFYHLGMPWASGGLLGVSIFFVLSGYLITDLLLSECEKNGAVDLKHFWLRRARRLLPGMTTLLAVLIVWVALFRPSLLGNLREDALAALFYVSNWWYIFHHLSYFASYETPSLLTHFWSLAVEEQFYLIWPLFIAFGFKYKGLRKYLLGITLIGAALSALLMGLIYQPNTDPSRVYYGTDTRAFSILLGAGLAFIWPSQKLSDNLAKSSRSFLDIVGSLALVMIIIMIWLTNQYDNFIYQGGLVVLSLATVIVIAVIAHPSTLLGRILGVKPLRWIGVRSYGMYLWHYPVIVLLSSNADTESGQLLRDLYAFVLIVILSSLSLKFIENPIRHGALEKLWRWQRVSGWKQKLQNVLSFRRIAIGIGALALILACVLILPHLFGNEKSAQTPTHHVKQTDLSEGKSIEKKKEAKTAAAKADESAKKTAKNAASDGSKSEKKSGEVKPKVPPAADKQHVTAIGDSIMVDVEPFLKKQFSNVVVDAKVGRQMNEATGTIQQLKKTGKLGNIVIIELGTNGPFSIKQLTSMLNSIGADRQIILVNVRVPRPWQASVNESLQQAVKMFPNASLVDWYSKSASHGDYFTPDAVHLKPNGAQVYASMLAKTVESVSAKSKS